MFRCANEQAVRPKPRCQERCASCEVWWPTTPVDVIGSALDMHPDRARAALDALEAAGYRLVKA
jgi:hypothetical protein